MKMTTETTVESGYTLIAVMALMMLIAISLLAVAPDIAQQIQRQKEQETIYRGEEVAEAIRQYVVAKNCQLPKSMDDLLKGLPEGTKNRQILRESSAIDPLSPDGKWRLVKPSPQTLANFARRIMNYNGGLLPDNPDKKCFDRYALLIVNVINKDSEEDSELAADETDITEEEVTEDTPFLGVVSGSKQKSILTYYGIENHSKWIFTPLFRGTGVGQQTVNSAPATSGIDARP
jgi:type II secretory pathway pseudopilin PulG